MSPVWYDSKSLYTKILMVEHGLKEDWSVVHPFGSGNGVNTVETGSSSKPPPMIADMLKVHGVWKVISADKLPEEGGQHFIIIASEPKYWSNIKAEVEAALAKHLP